MCLGVWLCVCVCVRTRKAEFETQGHCLHRVALPTMCVCGTHTHAAAVLSQLGASYGSLILLDAPQPAVEMAPHE